MNEHHQPFEEIRHYGTEGQEFWSARELAPLLDYRDWRNFQKVLARATQACEASNQAASDHFVETTKMVVLGSGAQRELEDVHLSRYACYLVVQNGDPAKPVIAAGQTYFAIQTRRQELADDEAFRQLREDEKRLFLRNELKEHNSYRFRHISESWLPGAVWWIRSESYSSAEGAEKESEDPGSYGFNRTGG